MKKLSKVKSNFYFFQKRKKIVVEVMYTVDPPRLDLLFAGRDNCKKAKNCNIIL